MARAIVWAQSANVVGMPFITSSTQNVLTPGPLWNGTSGSGGTAPAENSVVNGSGFSQKAIGNFDEYPYVWVEDNNHTITVGAAIGDRGWISSIYFWMEGNSISVTSQTINSRTGSIGWCVTPQSTATVNGDATLYAYIRPVNGYERRISIPLTLNSNSSPIARSIFYINASIGSDTLYDGTQPTISGGHGPWATFQKGSVACGTGGAIVYYATNQTYLEDNSNPPPFNNANIRMTDFRPLTVGGIATISKTTRGNVLYRGLLNTYEGLTINMNQIFSIQGGTNGVSIYKRCFFYDSNGPTGPQFGYSAFGNSPDIGENFLVASNGQFNGIVESSISAPVVVQANIIRNITSTIGWDAMFLSNGTGGANLFSGTRVFGYNVSVPTIINLRNSYSNTLTVSSVALNTPIAGEATVTWVNNTTINTFSGDANSYCQFQTGVLTGQQANIISESNATFSTVINSTQVDATQIIAGDTAWVYTVAHSDFGQFTQDSATNINLENLYVQKYQGQGNGTQQLFSQSGQSTGSGTLTTSGTTVTFSTVQTLMANDFILLTSGAQSGNWARVLSDTSSSTTTTLVAAFSGGDVGSAATWSHVKTAKDVAWVNCAFAQNPINITGAQCQLQNGNCHWIIAQCTYAGQLFTYRNDLPGFALESFNLFDNIFEDMGAPPSVGFNGDNNQFLQGTGRGSNSAVGGSVNHTTFQTSGISKTMTGNSQTGQPLVPWDLNNNSISSSAIVGAVQ